MSGMEKVPPNWGNFFYLRMLQLFVDYNKPNGKSDAKGI